MKNIIQFENFKDSENLKKLDLWLPKVEVDNRCTVLYKNYINKSLKRKKERKNSGGGGIRDWAF